MNIYRDNDLLDNTAYQALNPDRLLDAIESVGLDCDGRMLALNSYENRVYQVGLEDGGFVIAKFYRAGRWSNAAILEEHAFSFELAEMDIPVVAPLTLGGTTLHEFDGFRFALYPRRGGRWPELDCPDNLLRLGRLLGRLHAVGAVQPFQHRPTLSLQGWGREACDYLFEHDFIPSAIAGEYRALSDALFDQIERCFGLAKPLPLLRLHGDCHPGNILWTPQGAHLVDLDDCCNGPALQDIWMLLSGDRLQMSLQLSEILAGYEEFYDFPRRQLHLVEALRTLRLFHYSAWLAKRWSDPAFPLNFPWFNTERYWEEQLLNLREQRRLLAEPPLSP